MTDTWDLAVIGAGFGGLGAAVTAAERGMRVLVLEALRYPGGCASTFHRRGVAFESGATLFSGFAPGDLFARWIERHGLEVELDWIDPLIELRAPGLVLGLVRERDEVVAQLLTHPDVAGDDAARDGVRRFFALQARVADALWPLFGDPALLPPLSLRSVLRHARRGVDYLSVMPWLGRPLEAVLERCGVAHVRPLRTLVDALCQITVQTDSTRAEAPLALAALDYCHRGTAHVRGGIGRLAEAMLVAVDRLGGGGVRLAHRVKAVRRTADGFEIEARRQRFRARRVVANLVPADARRLLGLTRGDVPWLDRLDDAVTAGWGAAMLYRVVGAPPGGDGPPHHLELVDDTDAPFIEGNHVFCSFSGAGEPGRGVAAGQRTMTASTHVPLPRLLGMSDEERAGYVATIQDRMRTTIARRAPEWTREIALELPASPRTFHRFTGRTHGAVGGVPRVAGLGNYRHLTRPPVVPGFHLVGDSIFPGQSTLATALGGARLAQTLR